MVENYGETVQDRAIPNPIRTFDEAYANFRESLPWAIHKTLFFFCVTHCSGLLCLMHRITNIEGE